MIDASGHVASLGSPARPRLALAAWAGAIALAAVVVGVAAGARPELALVGVAGLALVPLVLARPIVGLGTVLALSFVERYAGVSGAPSLTKLVGALLIVSVAAAAATAPRDAGSWAGMLARRPVLAAALLLFLAWAAVSIAWATDAGEARATVGRYALNFALFPVALAAVRTTRHVVGLLALFVAAPFVTVVFQWLDPSVDVGAADADRLGGAGVNPNQLGTYLVVAMVLAAAFFANRGAAPIVRAAALAAAGVGGVLLFLTLSRGALIGLAAAVAVAPFAAGRGRRAATLALAVVTIVGAAAWFTAVAPATAVERITHPGRDGGSGRTDLWRVGWRIVEDHPVAGAGAGNFAAVSPGYVLRPGSTESDKAILVERKGAHNIYLTVLSELGAVGLALFLVIAVGVLRCALGAARTFARLGETWLELLARALFVSLVALLVADFFSSALFSKQLWILMATAPAMLAVALRRAEDVP